MTDSTPAPSPAIDEHSLIAERRNKLKALREHGISPVHRRSFRPVAELAG